MAGSGFDIKKMYPVLAVNIDSKSKIIFRLDIGYYPKSKSNSLTKHVATDDQQN